jgi:hypothetical protein
LCRPEAQKPQSRLANQPVETYVALCFEYRDPLLNAYETPCVLYSFLLALLAANLLLGARVYFYSAQAAPASDNPYENYKLLADVMEKVRLEYVDGDKVGYQDLVHAPPSRACSAPWIPTANSWTRAA